MLQVSHIAKNYRKNPVLTDVNFTAGGGECIGLIGHNGCGKSTLLQILAGILKPDSGSVLFNGEDLLKNRKRLEASVGFVPQENPLFEDATALEHLRLWYSGTGCSLSRDLREGLPARLGVDTFLDRRVSSLSGGMKKRLALACTLCRKPSVILMDEPAAALDLPGKAQIRAFLGELRAEGKLVIFATHEEADFPLCTSLLVFQNGCVRKESPADTDRKGFYDHIISEL